MADPKWILERRERRYNVVKKVVSELGNEPFTARSLIPKVRKAHWSYERWRVSTQTITGALNRLRREGFIEKVGSEHKKGINKRFSSNLYRSVGVSLDKD